MPLWKKSPNNAAPTGETTRDMWGRDPSQFAREVAPEFVVGEGGQRASPEKYILTMCHVCHLQLFPKNEVTQFFPAAVHSENTQYNTAGGLSLCERHYNLVNELTRRQIPVDKWPSQLIRGIVTYSREQLQLARDSIAGAQRGLSTVQTTRTVMTPAPIIGNAYSPVTAGTGTGSFTNYFFAFPVQRQVVDQDGVNTLSILQNSIEVNQQRVAHFSEQLSRYSELLDRTRRENPPRFLTDIRCGQSEMPLGTETCIWCGKNQGYSGDITPVNVLVEDVDPMGVVPVYVDRTGTEIMNQEEDDSYEDTDDDTDNESDEEEDESMSEEMNDVFCTQCGMQLSDPRSKFCDNCGAENESKTTPNTVTGESGNTRLPEANHSHTQTGSHEEASSANHSAPIPQFSEESPAPFEPIKFCPECGKKLPFESVKFCPYCGEKIPNPRKT